MKQGWYKMAMLDAVADLLNKKFLSGARPDAKDIFVQCYECRKWQTDNQNPRYNPKSFNVNDRQPYIWKAIPAMSPRERGQATEVEMKMDTEEGNVSHGLCGDCYGKMLGGLAARSGKSVEDLLRDIDRRFGDTPEGKPDLLPDKAPAVTELAR